MSISINQVTYEVPTKIKNRVRELPIKEPKFYKHYLNNYLLNNVPGDGYCGSYAVAKQLGEEFCMEAWSDSGELAIQTFIKHEVDYFMTFSCNQYSPGHTLVIYKNPTTSATVRKKNPKIIKLYYGDNHFQICETYPETDYNLKVNWKPTFDELEFLFKGIKLNDLATANIMGVYENSHNFENTNSHVGIMWPLDERLFDRKNYQDADLIPYDNDPTIALNNNISTYLNGTMKCGNGVFLDRVYVYPIISISTDGSHDNTEFLTTIYTGDNVRRFGTNNWHIYPNYDNETFVFPEFDDSDSSSSIDLNAITNAKIACKAKANVKTTESEKKKKLNKNNKIKKQKENEDIVPIEDILMKTVNEESSNMTDTWPIPSNCKSMKITSQMKNLYDFLEPTDGQNGGINQLLKDSFLNNGIDELQKILNDTIEINKKLTELQGPKYKEYTDVVKTANFILWIRGALFENFIRHHKMNFEGEMSMSEFILKLNKYDSSLTKKVFLNGMSDCTTKEQISLLIKRTFRGSKGNKLEHLVQNKTPDIINVSFAGEWSSLIVCDPSSAKSPYGRKKEKLIKYQNYRSILNSSNLVDLRLEAPVINNNATNIIDCLYECRTNCQPNIKMVNQLSPIITILSYGFNELRKNCASVMAEFLTEWDMVDMGKIDSLIPNIEENLTERDIELTGLTKEEIKKIFNFKSELNYETEESKNIIENSIVQSIKDSISNPSEENTCLAERKDIHLNNIKKLETISESLKKLKEKPPNSKEVYRPDPMGHFPSSTCFKKSKTGPFASLEMLREVRTSQFEDSWIFEGAYRFIEELNDQPEYIKKLFDSDSIDDSLVRKSNEKLKDQLIDKYNDKLTNGKITGPRKFKFTHDLKYRWKEYVSEIKKKRNNGKDLLTPYNEKSVKRIEEMVDELEEESKGDPIDCINMLFGKANNLDEIERQNMLKYFKTKGGHISASYHKMCFELNALLSYSSTDEEVTISSLGIEGVFALVLPGCRLSDSDLVRHVKFIIKKDRVLKGQKFWGEEIGDYFIQSGFSKITHKSISHFLNMPLCLAPLYNESRLKYDLPDDDKFKRSIHQLYWMAADSTTNKTLGIVRYLALLVFSVVCRPDKLISSELSCEELKWRKDIHVYTVDRLINNLPILTDDLNKQDLINNQLEGELAMNEGKSYKRLLTDGHHKSFREMLNEFYMYHTWDKNTVSKFVSTTKIFNKLIKSRHSCKKMQDPVFERLKNSREFKNDEHYINCGIRLGFEEKSKLVESIEFLLREVKEDQQGVGSAAFLSYATDLWIDEHDPDMSLSGVNFQPMTKGLETLSNTRGSVEMTDLIKNDEPILCDKLSKLNINDKVTNREKEIYKKLTGKKINTYAEMMGEKCEVLENHLTQFEMSKSYLPQQILRPNIIKKRIAKKLSKLGYDIRSKCLITVIEPMIESAKNFIGDRLTTAPTVKIDDLIYKFIENKLDIIHGLSPKTQHLSERELRIMDIYSKATMKVVEDLARTLNSLDKRETSQTDKSKQLTQENYSRRCDKLIRTGHSICIKLSADKSKWGPGILPTEFLPILRRVGIRCNNLEKISKLSMFFCIKLQSKRVMVPKDMLTEWWTKDLDMERMKKELPHLEAFMNEYDPTVRCTFDNVNDMGQGMLNALSSFKHLVCSTASYRIYYKNVKKTKFTEHYTMLSSDDSLEIQTFRKDKTFFTCLTIWLKTKTCCWRLGNMISNTKKTAGSYVFSEYNSNFNLPPFSSPPNIKQIIACGQVNFDYSWSNTVKGKLSQIKSCSENGVTNSTCRILNMINKKFYEGLFGIEKIKETIRKIAPDPDLVIKRMENGNIEYGRFPLVDPVKLNVLGSYEFLMEGMKDVEQLRWLIETKDNPILSTENPEKPDMDSKLNTLGLRSFSFRLHKISKLENQRTKFKDQLSEISFDDELEEQIKKLNPFYILQTPKSLGEQILQIKDTLMSSSVQNAFLNISGLKGIIRMFGMRYHAKYGILGSKTENFSFASLIVYMNMISVYGEPDINYKQIIDNELIDPGSFIKKLESVFQNKSPIKPDYKLPEYIEVMKDVVKSSLKTVEDIRPVKNYREGNVVEPTLLRKPEWNNDYIMKTNAADILTKMWSDELPNVEIGRNVSVYDRWVCKEKFKIKETLKETQESWNLEDGSATLILLWLDKLVKGTYKKSQLIYGRSTSAMGFRKMVSDLYCFNDSPNYTFSSSDLPTQTPQKWNYGDDLYEYLNTCCVLCNLVADWNSFKTICHHSLIKLNKYRISIGKPKLAIDPKILIDGSVHMDIRFVCSALLTKHENIDYETSIYLDKIVNVKSHRYVKKQETKRENKTEYYIENSDCTVEYYNSGTKMRICHRNGYIPELYHYSQRENLNSIDIQNSITDFLTNKCRVSYFDNLGNFNKKLYVDLQFTKKKKSDVKTYFDLSTKRLSKTRTKYTIPILHDQQGNRNVIKTRTFENFDLSWSEKCIKIVGDLSRENTFSYSRKVLWYSGSLFVRTIKNSTAKIFMDCLSSILAKSEYETLINLMKMFDNLANTNMMSTEFSGASIAACQIISEERKVKDYKLSSIVLELDMKLKEERVSEFLKQNNIKTDMYRTDVCANLNEVSLELNISTMRHEIGWMKPEWKEKLELIIDTMEIGLVTDIDYSNNEYAIEEIVDLNSEEEVPEVELIISDDNNHTIRQKIINQVKRYENKWKENSRWFDNPKDCDIFQLKFNQSFANDLLKKLLPIFKRTMEKRKNGWLDKSERLGSMICECFFINSQSHGKTGIKKVSEYKEYLKQLCKKFYKDKEREDIYKKITREFKMSVDHPNLDDEIELLTDKTKEELLDSSLEEELHGNETFCNWAEECNSDSEDDEEPNLNEENSDGGW